MFLNISAVNSKMKLQLLALLTVATLSGLAYGEVCMDTIRGCSPLWCRFRAFFLQNRCQKTCGRCTTMPPPTTRPPNQWSDCSRSCDTGTRVRVRNNVREYEDCNTQKCPDIRCGNGQDFRYNTTSSCCRPSADRSCGVHATLVRRIIGGVEAMQENWPWMLRFEQVQGNQLSVCGAFIINNLWAVTAGHCVANYDLGQFRLRAAYRTSASILIPLRSARLHPGYNIPENDIALLEFRSRVTYNEFIRPICLPRGEIARDDTKCFIAGWGSVQNNPLSISNTLQEGKIRVLPFGLCTEAYKSTPVANQLNANMHTCAGTLTGEVDSCVGDSGGPLMCQRCSSCGWYAAGLVSVGPSTCGTPGMPGIYTRLHHYQQWIDREVGTPRDQQGQTFTCA